MSDAPRRAPAAQDAPAAEVPLRRRLLHIVVVDALILAELAAAVYFASRHEEQFTLVFMGVFFGLLIPTMLASKWVARRLHDQSPRAPDRGSALIH